MQTYCLSCRKHTDNITSRKVIIIRKKSRSANRMVNKSRLLKQKLNKKNGCNNISPKLFVC